jgi:hypothetical protein
VACSPFAPGNVSPETATSHRGGLRDGTTLSDDRLRDDGPSDEGLRNNGLVVCRRRLENDEMRGRVRGENQTISPFMLSVGINRVMSANDVCR